jgi:putative salt-induced outer membrane protein YdiY
MRRAILVVYSLVLPFAIADQITVKNGDRITGSVIKKDGKTVVIKSDVFGLVTIPWDQVQTIATEEPVNVGLATGQTVQGKLTTRDQELDIEGAEPKRGIALTDIATLRDANEQRTYERLLSPSFRELWAGAASLGFAGTQGNAKTRTLTTAFNAARITNSDKTTVYFSAIRASAFSNNISSKTAQAVRGGVGYSHNVSSRLFVNAFNDYEYDRFQNLDLRFVLGGGLGYIAWKGESGRLDVLGGFAYNRESFGPPAPAAAFTRNSAEAYIGDDFTYKLSAISSLYQSARIFPNLSNTGEYRMNFDLGANTKVAKWLVWNVAISDRYLSNPVVGRQKNDLLYTTGIGVTFAK